VTLPVFPFLVTPVIAGPTAEGQTLTAVPQWSSTPPGGASFGYSWSRCTAAGTDCVGTGATGQQYALTALDVGDVIRVAVSDSEPTPGASQTAAVSTSSPVSPAGGASTTFLLTSPSSARTNQLVTVIATVTSSSSDKPPSGTIAFSSRGSVIPGCGAIPTSGPNQSVTVICLTTFAAATSAEQLTAAFTPSAGSPVSGSGSAPVGLTIRKDSTTTSIDVSNPTVGLGSPETYTANVQGSLEGSLKPSGAVEFLDHGQPIFGCTKRPLTGTSAGSQASCVVRYGRAGSHAISVSYPGDANYLGSGSQGTTQVNARLISLGVVSSTMQWTFQVTRSYTSVLGLLINSVSAGTNVVVRCQGRGCPFARRSTTVRQITRCSAKKVKGKLKCTTQRSKDVNLGSGFRSGRLRNGARITVFMTRPDWVGKYYQFAIRAGGAPRIRIACLAPGSTAPGVGC
jgi:hypothetical protein